MKASKWLIVAFILCLFPVTASAEWERTISAWDTRLPAQGKLQVSLWDGYETWGDEGADGKSIVGTLYVNYGLTDKWSVCLAPSFYRWQEHGIGSESGLSDTGLMTTYRFLDESKSGLDLAVMGSMGLPTGDEDKYLGSGNVEPAVRLLASKTLGSIIAVANVGARKIIDPDKGEKDFVLSADVEGIYPLNDKLSLNGVLSGNTARWDSADAYVDLGVGARFTPHKQLFVTGSVYRSLTSDVNDWYFQLGVGFEF